MELFQWASSDYFLSPFLCSDLRWGTETHISVSFQGLDGDVNENHEDDDDEYDDDDEDVPGWNKHICILRRYFLCVACIITVKPKF